MFEQELDDEPSNLEEKQDSMYPKVILENKNESLEMIEQKLDDEPNNLGEKQVSMKQKVTLESGSESGWLDIFIQE